MLELLFLLLPIAAGYGWYMGRRSVRQDTQQQSNQFSRQYVAGLNYLLSDESDKAVDLFIQLLEVDSETIETHLSLGNLFRQRGETRLITNETRLSGETPGGIGWLAGTSLLHNHHPAHQNDALKNKVMYRLVYKQRACPIWLA